MSHEADWPTSPDEPQIPTPAVERAILGALFLDPVRWVDVDTVIRPEDFTDAFHRDIFGAMASLYEATQEFDPITVGARLALGFTDNPGKHEDYLDELGKEAVNTRLLDSLARDLRARTDKRRLEDVIGRAQKLCGNGQTVDEIRGGLLTALSKNADESLGAKPADFLNVLQREYDLMLTQQGSKCVPTGYVNFDRTFGGIPCGGVTYLGSRPGVGKSSLAYNIILNVARQEPVVLFTLEVREEEFVKKILSIVGNVSTEISYSRLDRMPNDDERRRLNKAMKTIEKLPISVFDKSDIASMPVQNVVTRTRQLARSEGCRFFVVDYVQQLESGLPMRNSPNERMTHVSKQLQGVANELNVAILALSQFNRDPEKEDRAARGSDFRDSGSLEQDAHVLITLARRLDSAPSWVNVIKYKNGPLGRMEFHFTKETLRFTEGRGLPDAPPPQATQTTYTS